MPNRILRQGILTSPRMAKLGWAEEVFYRRLHSVVDDFGRYYADAGLLRAACYPRQLNKVSDSDIGKWLSACSDAALVRVYPAEDGERYLEVLDFGQQVRAKKSMFPDPLSTCVADAKQTPANAHLDVSVSGGGDVDDSVPKGTDGVPPAPAEKKAKSPEDMAKAELWQAAVSVLEAGGCPKSQCRTFMGKLVQDYTLPTVQQAVAAAVAAQPADAREYLKATCQRLKGERKEALTVASDAAERTARELAEQDARAAALKSPEEQERIRQAIAKARGALKVVA
jgi:hypothetical protein